MPDNDCAGKIRAVSAILAYRHGYRSCLDAREHGRGDTHILKMQQLTGALLEAKARPRSRRPAVASAGVPAVQPHVALCRAPACPPAVIDPATVRPCSARQSRKAATSTSLRS